MAVETLRPNGAGDITEFIATGAPSGWQCIDEVSSDNDTTYVTGSGGNFVVSDSLYTIEPSSLGSFDNVSSITVRARVKKDGGGDDPTIELAIKKSGDSTEYYPFPVSVSSASYVTTTYPTFPITREELDDVQIGARITNTVSTTVRITQMYVEVNYTALKRIYLI